MSFAIGNERFVFDSILFLKFSLLLFYTFMWKLLWYFWDKIYVNHSKPFQKRLGFCQRQLVRLPMPWNLGLNYWASLQTNSHKLVIEKYLHAWSSSARYIHNDLIFSIWFNKTLWKPAAFWISYWWFVNIKSKWFSRAFLRFSVYFMSLKDRSLVPWRIFWLTDTM